MASQAKWPGSQTPIRTTLLYGAAFGLLAGIVIVAATGHEGPAAIRLWRNAILIGGGIGFFVGLVRRWMARSERDSSAPRSSSSESPPG